ncbi:MAG: phosphoglycerate mutase family protein [Bernardetiaceae bacterium]|jgi:probable phosphoglycerate mutase|nr:phosphoglycerate mutase family protein [Bernardetiaceae bacterium]
MKPSVKNIITIQHTESIHHTNGMVGSWTDWELSQKGKKQAEQIGEKLAKELHQKTFEVYSSTLLRAKQTADIVCKHLKINPKYTEKLKERNLGLAVGKSVEWLWKNIEKEENTIDEKCFQDAESRRDVWHRLSPFYEEILNSEVENIMLVSHGDTLSIFNAMWLGLNPEFLNHYDLQGKPGGVSFFVRDNKGKHIINKLSDMSYL